MKEGVYIFDINLLNFLNFFFILVSIKIYGKKQVQLLKKIKIPK